MAAIAKGTRPFPPFEKARQAGVLEDGNGLIVAPTATGKSYIGRTILRRAVERGERGVHAYLVPYRALAAEMYEPFLSELASARVAATVRLSTGDHTDPLFPQETDILVATCERFAGLLRDPSLSVGRVVLDEIHLVADPTRGPVVEGLLARIRAHKPPRSLCALSAVVSDPEEIGQWLGPRTVVGDASDQLLEIQ